MKRKYAWCALLLGALLLTGCSNAKTVYETDNLRAVRSTDGGVTTLDVYCTFAGAELSEAARGNLKELPVVTEEEVTLSDGQTYGVQTMEQESSWHTGLFQSWEQLEELLGLSLVQSTAVQYPADGNHFYVQYSENEGSVAITCAQTEQDGMTISPDIFFYLDTQGKQYITGGMEVSKQVAHETYAPIEGKQVETFADDSTQAAKILVQENNILYVWNLTCGMQEAKQFADTLAWPVPEATRNITRG